MPEPESEARWLRVAAGTKREWQRTPGGFGLTVYRLWHKIGILLRNSMRFRRSMRFCNQ